MSEELVEWLAEKLRGVHLSPRREFDGEEDAWLINNAESIFKGLSEQGVVRLDEDTYEKQKLCRVKPLLEE